MKTIPALIAGIITSAVIVAIMMVVGVNALLNPNTVAEASAPGDQGTTAVISGASSDSAQLQQLQARIAEYQSREKQYQDQVKQLETNLQQANNQLQQYQQLMDTLQQMGIIRISQDGQILLPRFRGGD
jgi:peptidoglycan hydrolase CwlO-like protein